MAGSCSKIFFFDLDGTLLTSEKKISEKTMNALKKFTDAGNHFCINTGRAIDSAKAVYQGLHLDFKGSFLCGSNGTEIYSVDDEKYVYKTGVPLELVPRIIELSEKFDVHCHTYNENNIVSKKNGECMEYYRRVIKTPLVVTDDIMKELPTPPSKMIAIELHDHEKHEKFRMALQEMAGDKLTLLYSNPYYLEIFPSDAGKGSAVKRLADYLGIDIRNTYAAGDEQNDISMIEAAGCGIAMINGTEATKKSADVITRLDNDHDGLAEFILNAI
ncbi:MAG: HAD family phosphatase [Butyrivibrio sp.]|uniref:Cof-type HAD-IIB family hydrolase n=1 Tax=Butyrivibrio sp. TaxID=28121 RepID=UPI001B183EE7|nr:Cof-type HAD-IIB family hydrolase [Butyrivibrio sp.]MBO6240151.1 HAD family phosphatase [Butyrivibrio sp.]